MMRVAATHVARSQRLQRLARSARSLRLREHFVSLLVVLLPTVGWTASPFYLTVERSYAPEERATVRLDFSRTREPLTLRVLQPKNLERFLDGQLNLSRAYEEPTADLNPAHFLAVGINRTQNPLELLRGMLSVDLRRELSAAGLKAPLRASSGRGVVQEPAEVVHGPPEGFTVTREMLIDLQKGGGATGDVGWWFLDSGYEDGQYQIRSIDLDPLPSGIYLVQGLQGKNEAQALLQVSALSTQIKQSSAQLLVRAIDRKGAAVQGAKVAIRDGRGEWQELAGRTNAVGELGLRVGAEWSPPGAPSSQDVLDNKLVVKVVDSSGAVALSSTDFLPTIEAPQAVFLLTDRPIFKPGESFSFKGLLRVRTNGQLAIPPVQGRDAVVHLERVDGSEAGKPITVTINEFGGFSGEIQLSPAQAPGLYRLSAEVEGARFSGELRVKDYVKPTFFIELSEKSPSMRPGETFRCRLAAKRFRGGAAQGVKYDYFLYRKRFEVPQFVAESGGGLETGNDYFGVAQAATALSQPQRIFSSSEARAKDNAELREQSPWESAPTLGQDGTGEILFTVPQVASASSGLRNANDEWTYTLVIRAQDRSGALATVSENFYFTRAEVLAAVKFSKVIASPGEEELSVSGRATYPNGEPAAGASGSILLSEEDAEGLSRDLAPLPFTADERGVGRVRFTAPKFSGRLTAKAVVRQLEGRMLGTPSVSEPDSMLVSGKEGERIGNSTELELLPERTILAPGEKTRLVALLPKGWGQNELGMVWETVAGEEMYRSRGIPTSGRSRFFEIEARPEFGSGVYHTITVPLPGGRYEEQSVGFRIVPIDKRLEVVISPERPVGAPLAPFRVQFQVLDFQKKPVPHSELTVTVVDRAVYSVQPEFRPSVFDFFFPLPRLNLATFYSDSLQGYGYADEIKRPNFRLTALKNQSKPAKRTVRDTAGFFPHVVTDDQGFAAITLDLPANLTEWVVSSVVGDSAGRIGEGRTSFRVNTGVQVEPLIPQFLREGDSAQGLMKISSELDQVSDLKVGVASSGQLELDSPGVGSSLSFSAHKETLSPLGLRALGEHEESGITVALSGPTELGTGGARSYDLPVRSAALSRSESFTSSSGAIPVVVPEGAAVDRLEFRITSGLLGAALAASSRLVSYPFGCTEQLVHTTIPNLVLMDLLERAGVRESELGPLKLKNSAQQARNYAALGIQKLLANQKRDGGFALWPSEAQSGFHVSVMAARMLRMARELNVEGVEGPESRVQGYLWSALNERKFDLGSALDGYVLAVLAELNFSSSLEKEHRAFVQQVLDDPQARLDQVVNALQILKARTGQWWFREGLTETHGAQSSATKTDPVPVLLQRAEELYRVFDAQLYLKATYQNFSELGFGFGAAPVLASFVGVLSSQNALTPPLRSELVRKLVLLMRDGIWTSTFDTAQVLIEARALLAEEAKEQSSASLAAARTVKDAQGNLLASLERIPGGFMGEVPGALDPHRLKNISFEVRPGDLAAVTVGQHIPFGALVPRQGALTIKRSLLKLTSGGAQEIFPGESLSVGDTVISRLTLTRSPTSREAAGASDFFVVSDGIPALAEGLENDESYLADAGVKDQPASYWATVKDTQRYPDRVVRVVQLKAGGSMVVFQTWRVAFAGENALPPASVYDMYQESEGANTSAARFAVSPST